MGSNRRFAVALHMMVLLALSSEELMTSDKIAVSVNTNPVVVRRLLRILQTAGIVTSNAGRHGGSKLAKKPESITLWDVFIAIEEEVALHIHAPNEACYIGRQIPSQIGCLFSDIGQLLERLLSSVSLAQFVGKFEKTHSPYST